MVVCIWSCKVEERRCEYCSYRKGCEKFPNAERLDLKARYVDKMSEIVGMDILTRVRCTTLVWARYMVAYQMRQEGFTTGAIGKLLHMDHSTVTYAVKRINMMFDFPRFYPKELEIWQKYRESLYL